MPGNTIRYQPQGCRLSAAVYWRRRFLALLAGFTILVIIGWALSGALGGGPTGSNAADVGHTGHGAAGGAAPAGAQGAAAGVLGSAAGAQGSAAGTQGSAAVSPPAGTIAVKSPGPGAVAGPTATPADRPCSPSDVVISVFASQASYGQGQPPAFDVDVVSTSEGTCTFNVGPRYLSLVVTAGDRRVWGSADCAQAPGSLVANLARGVPAVLPVPWDLQTSAPGCAAAAGQAAAGSYAATALDGGITSNPVTFRVT